MRHAIQLGLLSLLLLTLPFWMACSHTASASPMIDHITKYDSLLSHEGDTVQIQGKFIKYNAMPQFGPENAYFLPGILLEGDQSPRLFLHREMSVPELDRLDGRQVTLQGIFHREEQLLPGDPPWTSRRTGSWMYEVTGLEVVGDESQAK